MEREENSPLPSVSRTEFEKLVVEGFELLPDWVREKIQNVALLIEDEPSLALRQREKLTPHETLLGYYHGTPLSVRGDQYGVGTTVPDTITIFQSPILAVAREELTLPYNVEAFKTQVRTIVADTVWHEFAHHFGMDEHEVRLREEKKRKR
jgi:predicted Zn-dependent protease with MMP-like domain